MKTISVRLFGIAFAAALAAFAPRFSFAAYDIPQSVIAGGGGTSAAGTYSVIGTIGQSVTGVSAAGAYTVSGGFWGGGASSGGAMDITVNVTIAGSGVGSVASTPGGISCPGTCGFFFNDVPSVSLTATPANGSSVFTGWLGACTGLSTCVISVAGTQNVTATFAPNNGFALKIDADENGTADAMTDGVMIVRYMLGLTGTPLITNALGINPGLMTGAAVKQHLDDIRPLLDIDGNGQVEALYDGLILMRYLFGIRGDALITNALGNGATRQGGTVIQNYIAPLLPP